MRRVTVAIATCVVLLGLTSASASASVVNQSVSVCQADATWYLSTPPTTANVTWDTGFESGCKGVNGTVYEDGDFSFSSFDFGQAGNGGFSLVGVIVTGQNSFAGTLVADTGTPVGTLEVVGGVALSAQMAYRTPNGGHSVITFNPNGTCGSSCYKTRMVLQGGWPGP
jgi:hypothetical protein